MLKGLGLFSPHTRGDLRMHCINQLIKPFSPHARG